MRPTRRAELEDLQQEKLEEYIEKVKEGKPNFAKNTREKILKLSGIIDTSNQKKYPTLAGTLIFGESPQSFYPGLFIACCVIPGTQIGEVGELGERFIDNKRVEGTIEEMLEESLNFLRRNMKTRVIINPLTGKRNNQTEYPLIALKEAITNALIHRDYSSQTENTYIKVYMYSDRIVIENPGTLYGTNRLEKLDSSQIMETRNPTIVRILEEESSIIENRHSGIPTMKREMKRLGLPAPEFYEESGNFKVIFRNQKPKKEQKKKMKNKFRNRLFL